MLQFLESDGAMKKTDDVKKIQMYRNWKQRLFSPSLFITSDYNYFRYSIQVIDEKKLIFHGDKRVIYYEQAFDLLHKSHIEHTGHAGRDIMLYDLKGYYGLGK